MAAARSKNAFWAKAVKERDGKCTECGREEDLHAHHIKQKSTHPELRFDIGNGTTLCYRCHKRRHEQERPARIRRSQRPHRKTLDLKIALLEQEISDLRNEVQRLANLVRGCDRGICKHGLELSRVTHPF